MRRTRRRIWLWTRIIALVNYPSEEIKTIFRRKKPDVKTGVRFQIK